MPGFHLCSHHPYFLILSSFSYKNKQDRVCVFLFSHFLTLKVVYVLRAAVCCITLG